MPLTPTNLYMNWSDATVTPPSPGTVTTVGEILDVSIDGKSVQETFFGGNRKFARLIRNTAKTRKIVISTGDVGKCLTIVDDVPNTIVVTLLDAVNGIGVGGGGITITAVNAVLEDKPVKGSNNKFGGGTLTFNCYGDGSDTDPVTVVVL